MTETTAVTETAPEVAPVKASSGGLAVGGAFGSIENFEAVQRMAGMLSASNLIPDTYKNNVGDCVIALEMASRLGANVVSVMQNMYIIHGKPSWSSQFMVACINSCGRFSPIRYVMGGAEGTGDRTCFAQATDLAGEVLDGPTVSIEMAKAEGWFGKAGSKWKTMPELMLRYRAATFFGRQYAPELTMGFQTVEEVKDITQEVVVGNLMPEPEDTDILAGEPVETVVAEVVEPEKKAPKAKKEKKKEEPKPDGGPMAAPKGE